MPSLNDFPAHMMNYVKDALGASADCLQESSQFGANYMRDYIQRDSPTGSKWHSMKNELNGFDTGSRMGGQIYAQRGSKVFQPSGHSGQMLKSIAAGQLKADASKFMVSYGWLQKREQYFLLQDTGGYINTAAGKDKRGVGMGLLNTAADGGGRSTLQNLGAFTETNKYFIDRMKLKGFKVSGSQTND